MLIRRDALASIGLDITRPAYRCACLTRTWRLRPEHRLSAAAAQVAVQLRTSSAEETTCVWNPAQARVKSRLQQHIGSAALFPQELCLCRYT